MSKRDLAHIATSAIAYEANKGPLKAGLALLKKKNKTEEEKIAAKSFRNVYLFILVMLVIGLGIVIKVAFDFCIAIVAENNEVAGNLMFWIGAMIFVIPIIIVFSILIPRASFGIPWREYYHKHYDKYDRLKEENM